MNDSERTVYEFLNSLQIGLVAYEPDGSIRQTSWLPDESR
jgi:hypothetical protein